MQFSIVTPTLNQDRYLSRTIDSVISQQGEFRIQYVVIDGGSTDHTQSILRRYELQLRGDPRVAFSWQSEADRGQSDAINKGMRLATGDVLAFINSDDYYLPGAFRTVANVMSTSKCDWLYGLCKVVDEHERPVHGVVQQYRNLLGCRYSYRRLLFANFIAQPATFWKRRLYKQVGDFDESQHFAMDYDYWCRLGSIGPAAPCREYLAAFRRHGQSKSNLHTRRQFAEACQTASRFTDSKLLLGLHRLHDELTLAIYRLLDRKTVQ